MARPRTVAIVESLEQLQELLEQHAGTPQGIRVQFLKYLKEHPDRTIVEAGKFTGLPRRYAIRVWDVYRLHGLSRVLRLGAIPDRRRERREPEPQPEADPAVPPIEIAREALEVGGMRAGALIGFMNAIAGLREIGDAHKWAQQLKKILIEFIPEVDYAVVTVNLIVAKSSGLVTWRFNQHIFPNGEIGTTMTMPDKIAEPYFLKILEEGEAHGFPVARYHFPPLGFDFHTPRFIDRSLPVYLGSILLFRKIESVPFTDAVAELIDSLRSFIEFVYLELNMRTRNANPSEDLFFSAVHRVAGRVGLSDREAEVLFLQLLGNTIEEIAELLHISTSTVRSHIQSIYRKAGVQRLSELFARYFTPRDYFPEKKKGSEG